MPADIYVPGMDVNLPGELHLFGRIRCNDLRLGGNAKFTYDEALGYSGADTDTFRIRSHLVE